MEKALPSLGEFEAERRLKAPKSAYLGLEVDESRSESPRIEIKPESIDLYDRKIPQIVNFATTMFIGILFPILPWFTLVQLFDLEVLCFDSEDRDETPQKCQNTTTEHIRWAFAVVSILFAASYYILISGIVGEPNGKTFRSQAKWAIPPVLIAMVITYYSYEVTIFLSPIQSILGIVSGIMFSKKWNRGGALLCLASVSQWTLMTVVMQVLSSYIKQPFIFGFQYKILIPFAVQANQGGLIMLCEAIEKILPLSDFNSDFVIIIVKHQMAYLSSWKLAGLLTSLGSDGMISTITVYVLLDALGRNQVWRLFFRWSLSKIRNKPMNTDTLKPLSCILLSSELDMSYVPILTLLLVKICDSPLIVTEITHLHSSNSRFKLRNDSLLHVSTWNFTILFLAALGSDLLTVLLSKLLCEFKLYEMRFIFAKGTLKSWFYGTGFIAASMYTLLSAGSILG